MARLKVVDVFEISGRGRCVAGDLVEGRVRNGMVVYPEKRTTGVGWRVVSVEYADSPAKGVSHVVLVLENTPALDELQRLLPKGSVLLGSE